MSTQITKMSAKAELIFNKISASELEKFLRTSKVSIKTNDCYGYSQLMTADGHGLNATLGDTKKDLYYQIQFYLDMKEAENRLKGKRY